MKVFNSFTHLIFFHSVFSYCSATSKLVETAVNISSTYYDHNFATTVIWKQNESDYVNEFLKTYEGSVVLSPWQSDNDSFIHDIKETVGFRQTVYFSTSLHDYAKFMKLLNEVVIFPIRFILVLENLVKTPSELSDVIEVTSKNDQADLVIISANDYDEVMLSTFFPYNDGLCGNYTPVVLNFGDDMFPQKFSNFYQCPIRVSLMEYLPFVTIESVHNNTITSVGGYDGETLMIILKRLNASLNVISQSGLDKYGPVVASNSTASVSKFFDDLATEKADIIIPGGLLTYKRFYMALASQTYHTKDIRWVGRKQQEVYDYLKFVVPDRTNFTPIHGLTFVLFVIVAMIIRRCKSHLTGPRNRILYQSFIILLGQSAKFVTKSSLLNSLFLLWIWFCFIFRIDYQADLVESLQTVELEPPLDSIETAITKVDGYGGSELFLEYYKDTPVESNYKIIPFNEIKAYIQRIFEGENYLVATDVTLVQLVTRYVQILENPISVIGTCLYMRPGWPAATDVNDMIFSLLEAGFIEKIFSYGDYKWNLNKNNDDANEPKGLNMAKLSACFYGLAIMWVVCSIVLVIEIVYHKYKMKITTRVV